MQLGSPNLTINIEMFQRESRKPIYVGVIRSNVGVTRHKNSAGVGLFFLHSCDGHLFLVIYVILFVNPYHTTSLTHLNALIWPCWCRRIYGDVDPFAVMY